MSYEFGPSGTYIYITEDGLNGQTAEHLNDIRQQILLGDTPPTEIVDTLDFVLEHPRPESNPVALLREQGKYLLGVREHFGGGRGTDPVDGLMFAQGEGLQESGAFSIVRMATWMRQGRKHPIKSDRELRNSLIQLSLTDINRDDTGEHGPWGVPVERTTRVVPLYPTESELAEGYVFGHRKDFEAIEGLSLPDELKLVFADVTATWHGTELEGDSSAFAESLRATLDGWKLPS